MITIKNLSAQVQKKPILKNFNLKVNKGEVHAIMGPNGSGKSTLAKVLAGDSTYEVTGGSVDFEGKDVFALEPEERMHLGLFMTFQYPIAVPGVSNFKFLLTATNSQLKAEGKEPLSEDDFDKILAKKMDMMEMGEEFKTRCVNEGFSGGEKKRNEILQMAVFNPKLAILDETDSGLDIDALRLVAKGINSLITKNNAIILITHYQRLLDYIKPHFVHVMMDGKIIQSGGPELALMLEDKGYDWLEEKSVGASL